MRANALLRYLCAILPTFMVSAQAADPGCTAPIKLDEKPALKDFHDYGEFLVAAIAFKSQEEDQRKHRKLCPELYQSPPVSEGPTGENLDQAVAASRDQAPFDYNNNPSWHNKSTSQSFGLAGMPNSQMAGEAIQTPLALLDQSPLSDRDRDNSLALLSPVDAIRTGAILPGQHSSQEYQQLLIAEELLTQAFGVERWAGGPGSLSLPDINPADYGYNSLEAFRRQDPQGYQEAIKNLTSPRGSTAYQQLPIASGPASWDSLTISPDGNLVVYYKGQDAVRTHTTIYYSGCWSSCYGK